MLIIIFFLVSIGLSAYLTPASGNGSVSPSLSSAQMVFNEAINAGSGTFTLYDESTETSSLIAPSSIKFSSAFESLYTNVVTLSLPSLAAGHLFHIVISALAIYNSANISVTAYEAPVCVPGTSCSPANWAFSTTGKLPPVASFFTALFTDVYRCCASDRHNYST